MEAVREALLVLEQDLFAAGAVALGGRGGNRFVGDWGGGAGTGSWLIREEGREQVRG